MPPDSIRMAIVACLENLSKADWENFLHELIHRGGDPRVRLYSVEGKTLRQITDTMVNTFTERRALDVTLELLRKIKCSQDADELVRDTKSLTTCAPPTGSTAGAASGAAPSKSDKAEDEHFIIKHRKQLIDTMSKVSINQVLDDLLQEKVITQEMYDHIRAISTPQDMMRELYSGPLKAGKASLDAFYNSLEEHNKYLVDNLKK